MLVLLYKFLFPIEIANMNQSKGLSGGPKIGIVALGRVAGAVFSTKLEDFPFLSRTIWIQAIAAQPGQSCTNTEISITQGLHRHNQPINSRGADRYIERASLAVEGLQLLFVVLDLAEPLGDEVLLTVTEAIQATRISAIAVAITPDAGNKRFHDLAQLAPYHALCQSCRTCIPIPDAQHNSLILLSQIYRSIVLPSTSQDGWIGVDFEDVMSVFAKQNGRSLFGIGSATGQDAEQIALQLAISSSTLGHSSLGQETSLLIFVEGRTGVITLDHIYVVVKNVRAICPNAHTICSAYSIDHLAVDFRITIITSKQVPLSCPAS